MKRTVLEKIAGLKGMMDRMESPELVMAEVNEIMDAINKEQDKEKKDQALGAMMKLTLDMMKESPLEKLLERLDKKAIPVRVEVNAYLDVTVIKIDKKVPYSNLLSILNKARDNFDQDTKDLYSAKYSVEKKHLVIDYRNEKHNDIIIDMAEWNLSEEVAKVYVEGFVEYLKK